MMLEKLKLIESTVLAGLKDFQLATAKRVFELYKQGQKRVLVADEVGLGKTLIAKGVIAQTARYHYDELGDNLFKVVYVCSNQVIANQNLNKLKIFAKTFNLECLFAQVICHADTKNIYVFLMSVNDLETSHILPRIKDGYSLKFGNNIEELNKKIDVSSWKDETIGNLDWTCSN